MSLLPSVLLWCGITIIVMSISHTLAIPLSRPSVVKFGTLMDADESVTANRLAGLHAAFRDAHEKDELYGTTIELVHLSSEDDQGYDDTKHLVENEGVFGMVSTEFSAAVPSWVYCEEHNIPNIAPEHTHAPMFERGSNSTFFLMQSFEAEANKMVNYLINSEWNCWNIFIGYYYEVESVAKTIQATLKKLGYPAPRLHPVGSDDGEPYNMTDYLNQLYNATIEPNCIMQIDAADGVFELMEALTKDPRYEHDDMVVIAPSVAARPHFAINGSTKPFENLHIIQSFPDPNEADRFKSVASYQGSINRFFNTPNWQNIYSKYPVLTTLVDQVHFNADAYQGYINGRFLIEILRRMPTFTRQAMIDTIFETKLFEIDDMLLGPFARECSSSYHDTACWCNSGAHTLFVSRVVNGTPKLVVDNEIIGEFGVAHTTIPFTKCSYDSSSFTTPVTIMVQHQVSDSDRENRFYELTNALALMSITSLNKAKTITNGLQIRARLFSFNSADVSILEDIGKDFLGELADEYGCMANVGPTVLNAGTERIPGFVTSKFTLDLRDPPKEDFDRNTFYFNGVLMDYIHASARYAVDNYEGGVILVGENAEILDMAVSSLHTFQQDYLEKWDIATESDDVAKGESFMAKKIGRVANILYAGQDFFQLIDVVRYALENPTAHVAVATSETLLGGVFEQVGQNFSFTNGSTFGEVLENLETNLVFPSFANAWWDATHTDPSLLGILPKPTPFALMNAMTTATVMFEAANKFGQTGPNTALRGKPTALADILYEAQSLSVGSLSFGPFSDQTCKADQIATKSAACQCNKGPRKFYIHHVNDWIEGTNSENKRTNFSTWTMSSCGVRYEPLKRSTDYTTEIITAASVLSACAIILALVIFKVVTAPTRDNSAAPKNPDDPFTIIFTDIQSSTSLWARAGEQMSLSVEKHHSLIRKLIKKYDGYEVKTIGDSFMVAFSSTKKAVAFALSIQGTFFDEKWPKEIDETYIALEQEKREAEAEDGKSPVLALPVDLDRYSQSWNGLRVRIGCHYGFGNVKFDPTVLGYDYYGTVVNTAARVEGVGHGGQVLLTAAALSALIDENKGSVPDDYVIKDLGPQPLRGLDEPVALHQFLTPEIKGREFPELRLDIEKTGEDDSETEDELFSNKGSKGSDSDGSKMTTESVQQALDKYIERICRKWKGDLSFVQTYQEVQLIFQFVKSLWSTSSSSYRTDSVDHLGKKWKVEKSRTLKGALAENVRIVNIIVKVKKTIDITNKPKGSETGSVSSKMKNTYNGHTFLASISNAEVLSPQLLPHGTPYNSANNRLPMPKNSPSKDELFAHSVDNSVDRQQSSLEGGVPQVSPGQPELIPQHPAIPASTNDQPFRLQDPPPPRNTTKTGEHRIPGNQSESPRTVTLA